MLLQFEKGIDRIKFVIFYIFMFQILLVVLIYFPSLSLQKVDNPQTETLDIPVKRLLSRHRRFIAPGTRCQFNQHLTSSFLRQFTSAKKLQTQTLSTERLQKKFCIKKLLVKIWWNWHQMGLACWLGDGLGKFLYSGFNFPMLVKLHKWRNANLDNFHPSSSHF